MRVSTFKGTLLVQSGNNGYKVTTSGFKVAQSGTNWQLGTNRVSNLTCEGIAG